MTKIINNVMTVKWKNILIKLNKGDQENTQIIIFFFFNLSWRGKLTVYKNVMCMHECVININQYFIVFNMDQK